MLKGNVHRQYFSYVLPTRNEIIMVNSGRMKRVHNVHTPVLIELAKFGIPADVQRTASRDLL